MNKVISIICTFITVLLLAYCKNDCANIENSKLLFERKYDCFLNKERIEPDDSMVFFISYSSQGNFDKALNIFSTPIDYRVIGSWPITEEIDTIKYKYCSINDFPYSNFSSRQLFIFSEYFYKKYDCKKELIDRLLRESLKKDSLNFYSIYNFLVLSVNSKEWDYSICLLNFLKSHNKFIEYLDEIESEIENNIQKEKLPIKRLNSIASILDSTIFVYDWQEGYYRKKCL